MSEEYETGQAWLVKRVVVGHGFGLSFQDDRFTDTAFFDLYCEDLAEPGHFAISPDDADLFADALKDAAQKAREMKAP